MNPLELLAGWQKVVLAVLLAAGVGYAFGRYATPPNVQIKTETVTKEVTITKRDVVTVTKEIKRPDGTVETETTTVDKGTVLSETNEKAKTSQVTSNVKPQWKAQGSAGYNFNQLRPIYGAGVERRILGPIFVGAYGNTDRTVGLTVSLEF